MGYYVIIILRPMVLHRNKSEMIAPLVSKQIGCLLSMVKAPMLFFRKVALLIMIAVKYECYICMCEK